MNTLRAVMWAILSDEHCISYRSAWSMRRRIRRVMKMGIPDDIFTIGCRPIHRKKSEKTMYFTNTIHAGRMLDWQSRGQGFDCSIHEPGIAISHDSRTGRSCVNTGYKHEGHDPPIESLPTRCALVSVGAPLRMCHRVSRWLATWLRLQLKPSLQEP